MPSDLSPIRESTSSASSLIKLRNNSIDNNFSHVDCRRPESLFHEETESFSVKNISRKNNSFTKRIRRNLSMKNMKIRRAISLNNRNFSVPLLSNSLLRNNRKQSSTTNEGSGDNSSGCGSFKDVNSSYSPGPADYSSNIGSSFDASFQTTSPDTMLQQQNNNGSTQIISSTESDKSSNKSGSQGKKKTK